MQQCQYQDKYWLCPMSQLKRSINNMVIGKDSCLKMYDIGFPCLHGVYTLYEGVY